MPSFDPERSAAKFALAGAVCTVLGGGIGGWGGLLLAIVGILLLIAACYSRPDGVLIFGPLVRFELVRAARTRRLALWRVIYALATSLLLLACFGDTLSQPASGPEFSQSAEMFFLVFAALQFVYLVYLTAAVIAPIAAEEREAKRWDFLLVTDLRAREILFGKAAGRLPQLLDPLLASLPILVLSTLFGGVSPQLVVVVAVATLAAILGTMGIAFFSSITAPTAKDATDRTIGTVMAVVMLPVLPCLALLDWDVWTFPTSVGLDISLEVGDLARWLSSGNPFAAIGFALWDARNGVDSFEPLFAQAVQRFAAFHLGVFFLFGLVAVQRLRAAIPWSKKPAATEVKPTKEKRFHLRPPVGDWPVYWWQRFGRVPGEAKVNIRLGWKAPLIAWFVVVGLYLLVRVWDAFLAPEYYQIGEEVRGGTMLILGFLAIIHIIAPGTHAVATIARERVADTLDSVRLTALSSRDILFEKWLGCLMADNALYGFILFLGTAAMVTGFLHPLSVLGVAIVIPVYGGANAAVGLYFSVRAATPATATRNMIFTLGFGFGLLAILASAVVPFVPSVTVFTAILPPFATGLTMTAGLASLTELLQGAVGIVIGLALFAGIGRVAFLAAVRRFEQEWHN